MKNAQHTVLITGGFGYLGGRLAHALGLAGYNILLGTRQKSDIPSWLPSAKVLPINWEDMDALEHACHGVQTVIHAAGMNAQDSAAEPTAALAFNGLATSRLIDAAANEGVARFIYLSTAHVYSSPLDGLIDEDSPTTNLHPYATSHLAGEHAVLFADRYRKLEGVVLRLSNAFGAPTYKDVNCWMLIVNDLCRQAVVKRELTLHSDGSQLRDFISIEAVCDSVNQIIEDDLSDLSEKVLNVGSGISKSIYEMAQLVQERCSVILGYNPELNTGVNTKTNKTKDLIYRSTNMEKIGLKVFSDPRAEIDLLLEFCRENFTEDSE